jgi:putative transposase
LADDRHDYCSRSPACRRSKKSDAASECLGQSVGGWSTKIHAAVAALGNPLRIILTVGQRADITQAEALVTGYRTDAVLADRGYDADSLITWLQKAAIEVVIPSKKNRLEERVMDKNLYKDRNKVERFFNKLKAYRRVATRYEKTATSFAGFVYLASAMILLH